MSPVYSVEIMSPENRASAVLPLELNTEAEALAVGKAYEITAHLQWRVVNRGRWEPLGGW